MRAQLRTLIQNAQHVVGRQGFLIDTAGHQHPRRRTAHRPRQLGFNKLHQARVGGDGAQAAGPHLARIGRKQGLRALGTHETLAQAQQVRHGGTAAPKHRPRRAGALEHIDKQQRLAGLLAIGRTPQRQAHIGTHVDQQAPEQRMRQVVQALQAKQLLGPQPVQAQQALGQEGLGQPARLGQ